jgi:hypothetical protein
MKAWKYVGLRGVLLLVREDDFDCLPPELQDRFKHVKGIPADIKTERALIGSSGPQVQHDLSTKGWHLWSQ